MIEVDGDLERRLKSFARSWFKRLALGDWEAALSMLDEPNSYGTRWSQAEIVAIVVDTFGPGTRFAADFGAPVFSDPDVCSGSARESFGNLKGGGFWLDSSVPLNGRFSDLTAQFEFHPRSSGFATRLQDLHVL